MINMSQSLMSLDKRRKPDQHKPYEHIAHEQPSEHMSPGATLQRAGRTERVPIMLRQDEVDAVDNFRFANRCTSRSDAIRMLMHQALKAAATEPAKENPDAH